MVLIEQIARSFGAGRNLLRAEETFLDAEWEFSISPWCKPEVRFLCDVLTKIPSRDAVRLSVSVDGGNAIALSTTTEAGVGDFLNQLATYHGLEAGQNTLHINLQISKRIDKQELSIYSLAQLKDNLCGLNTKQLFASFAPLCSEESSRCVLLQQEEKTFHTDTIAFAREFAPTTEVNRTNAVLRRMDICHFEGSRRNVLPEDFHLTTASDWKDLNDLYNRLCLIATLTFLSDVSSLADDGKFTFKLNGYRVITGEVGSQAVSTALLAELYKVYKWAYLDGSASDKLGLARNIISLHWKGEPSLAPDEGIYESILSGYAIYLKEHVDQYISLKKHLCDYLSAFSQKAAKLAEGIGEKLERNFVAFVGFFISTILLKAVTDKGLDGLFPKPLQIIAWGLIAASLIHGGVSLWFSLRERRRFIEDFNLLRLRYSDLLHKSDLDRVLGEDKGLRKTTEHLDFKLQIFFLGWLLMLMVCAAVVIGLSRTMIPIPMRPSESTANGVSTVSTNIQKTNIGTNTLSKQVPSNQSKAVSTD